MHTLVVVLVAAAAVCTIAPPPGPPKSPELVHPGPRNAFLSPPADQRLYKEYLFPQHVVPRFVGYEESPRASLKWPEIPSHNLLNEEIDRIHEMKTQKESLSPYELQGSSRTALDYMKHLFGGPSRLYGTKGHMTNDYGNRQPFTSRDLMADKTSIREFPSARQEVKKRPNQSTPMDINVKKSQFALTPLDKGYFEHTGRNNSAEKLSSYKDPHEGGEHKAVIELEPPRKIRQNPNLSRTKTLIAENLDRLRIGLSHEETDATDKPRHYHVLETTRVKPSGSLFGVAVIAAVGTSIAMAIMGFAFGWYILTKKAKAAADVDYPAYGVTGPTIDCSADRKLAQSAHMYHYQHQKQQIIAMERSGLEQRDGSISDPESEEENEEGDYTVYECPGFATTGDIEVKNPLFTELSTPATPGKCQVVKQQPKD